MVRDRLQKGFIIMEQTVKQIDLVFHLEKAIESGEFEVYFQPIIHTISGSLCAFEALARWHHPRLGFLPPVRFLPLLEETKQIYHLDIHIVELVCRWYNEQIAANRPVVPVSVNFSRCDFEAVDMFSIVESLMSRYGVPRDMLNIEITESAVIDEKTDISNAIERFRASGYQVWMDDFGSGYSSLNTLKEHVFDELKIDMCFLSDMSLRSRRIIRSIISMAKEISMVTICEGVETQEQVDFLRGIGCDRMQGYYFSKPLPYEELLEVLKEKNISFETKEDRLYYHHINRINLLSPSPFTHIDAMEHHGGGIPLAILELQEDGNRVFLYQDEEFRDSLRVIGATSAMDAIQRLTHFGVLTREEIENFLRQTDLIGECEINFSVNGDLVSAHAKLISEKHDRHAMLLSINNITQRMKINHEQLLDQRLKNLYSLYLRVSILRPQKDEMVTVFSQERENYIPLDVVQPLRELIARYSEDAVFETDRERFRAFLDPATLEQRVQSSSRGFINAKISTLDKKSGGYSKKMLLVVPAGNHEYILLLRYANL